MMTRVRVEVNTARGSTWKALDRGDLSNLMCTGDGNDSLCLCVSLTRDADGAAPVVPLPLVTCGADPKRLVILQDRVSRLTYDRANGQLFLIENLALKRQYNPGDVVMPGFSLFVKKPRHEGRWTEASEIRFTGMLPTGTPVSQIVCRYELPLLKIVVSCTTQHKGLGL